MKQCRYGCPAQIERFCLLWKTLYNGKFLKIYIAFKYSKLTYSVCYNNFRFLDNIQEVEDKLHNATMDSLNTPISSRGRRILPPLCYWRGE